MLLKTFASIAMLGLVGVVQAADQASVLVQEMRNELGGVLWPAFFEKGPLEALHICHEQAQTIAANHSGERVSISRVSHKARNPVNEVPAWAAHYYEQLRDKFESGDREAASVEFIREEGQAVSLRAISTSNQCLACHGGSIEPELHAAINRLYPEDQAIGFNVSDLRGAFLIQWLK